MKLCSVGSGSVLAGAFALVCAGTTGCNMYLGPSRPPPGGFDGGFPPPPGRDGGGFDGMCSPPADGGLDFSNADPTASDPPAIAGGTLLVTHDGRFVVASDPDQDAVFVLERSTHSLHRIDLTAHDEPGRSAEDAAGIVHVVLRGAGAVVRIDASTGTLLGRDAACSAPRGIAYRATDDSMLVTCMDGTLLTIPAAGGAATPFVTAHSDWRDVAFDPTGALFVTRFRSAEIYSASTATGTLLTQIPPAPVRGASPDVAWRMVPSRTVGVLVLHQLASTLPIDLSGCTSPYGNSITAQPIVQTAITSAVTTGSAMTFRLSMGRAPLAVDLAASPDGSTVALALAGSAGLDPDVMFLTLDSGSQTLVPQRQLALEGQTIAVAYTPDGHVVAQTRAPASIVEEGTPPVALGAPMRQQLGHQIFHTATSVGIACASCHAEGLDDGHVWNFQGLGERRTQTFRGGFLATAPFHWDGEFPDMPGLVRDVYVHRMGGSQLTVAETQALSQWMEHLPLITPPEPSDASAVDRGRALFNDATIGCSNCHGGAMMTNNASVNVGTGAAFQVPSLRGLRWRAPYMHNGCAATLADRFTDSQCGGGSAHGRTDLLTEAQRSDLIAYLMTL